MKKKVAKLAVFFLAFALVAGFAWAGSGRDALRGQDVIIGQWWEGYDVNTVEPRDEVGEQLLEYRRRIQREHNFTMREAQVAGWNEMLETATASIMAGRPAAQAFILEPGWAMALHRQGLLFPISDSKAVNLKTAVPIPGRQVHYNQEIQEIFTFGGKIYGTAIGVGTAQHGAGVYFNKRLFREAGLDSDQPYNMQRDGTWTWDNFIDIAKRLTRDRNNTGRINTWAMPADLSTEILDQIVFSNGGNYVAKDASGRFVNATARPEFIEALQFARRLMNEGVMMPRPEGGNWDWYWPQFHDGVVAMMMEPEWRRGQMRDMADDWGFVLFPKGPRARDYRMPSDENVIIVPATFPLAQVDAIMTAINLWYTPVTDDWKAGMWNQFRDRRAVDETMALMRDARYNAFRYWMLIPGINRGDIAWQMWWFDGDPAQLVESVSQNWNALIGDANR